MVAKAVSSYKSAVVPSSIELVKARQKDGRAANKKSSRAIFLVVVAVILIAVILFGVFFGGGKYKYSFNIGGVDFVSNEYTPSEFFSGFRDNNSFLLIIDVKEGENGAWVTNAMNLWIVALSADHKSVGSLVRMADSTGAIKSCATNDANVLVSRDLSLSECAALAEDSSRARVVIELFGKDTVFLAKNQIVVSASGESTVGPVNYFAIKQMYPNFDAVLAAVNAKIDSIN